MVSMRSLRCAMTVSPSGWRSAGLLDMRDPRRGRRYAQLIGPPAGPSHGFAGPGGHDTGPDGGTGDGSLAPDRRRTGRPGARPALLAREARREHEPAREAACQTAAIRGDDPPSPPPVAQGQQPAHSERVARP